MTIRQTKRSSSTSNDATETSKTPKGEPASVGQPAGCEPGEEAAAVEEKDPLKYPVRKLADIDDEELECMRSMSGVPVIMERLMAVLRKGKAIALDDIVF